MSRPLNAQDIVHTMFTKDYAEAYPDARVIGMEALLSKRPDIKWTGVFGRDDDPLADVPEMKARYFKGFVNQVRCYLDIHWIRRSNKPIGRRYHSASH